MGNSRIGWFVLTPSSLLRALEAVELGYSPEEVMLAVMDISTDEDEEEDAE